jgi:hypothetical protein
MKKKFVKKIKLLSVCFITLFVSCSKNESIKNVSFKGSLVYFENELLSGTVYENYSNGSIFKSYNIEDGVILDQTHFSKKGDTLATMYYNEDGSYNRYTDKSLKNNNINFGCSVISKDGSSKCIGSNNIPDANFRLARLYDFWIKSNNLTEAYGSPSPTYPKGGATIGRARGESSMSLTGTTAKDWFQLQAGNLLKPEGPYTSDKIFVSIKYSTDGFNEENFNEEASLSWNIDEQTNANEVFSPSNIIMKANYSPKDGSSSGAMFSAYLGEEGNYYVMNVIGSNNNFIYSAKMEFLSEKDLKISHDIFTGYTIIDPPGYDFNKFELYLNGDKKQGSVLSIRRNHNSKLNNYLENQKQILNLSSDNYYKKAKEAFEKVKSDKDYIFSEYTFEKVVIKNSFKETCGDDTCVSFVLTEQFLVISYRTGIHDMGTHIIDLNSGKNIIDEEDSYVYVNDFDIKKSILKIDTNGLDENGRYFKNGTYNLKTKVCQLGEKEY